MNYLDPTRSSSVQSNTTLQPANLGASSPSNIQVVHPNGDIQPKTVAELQAMGSSLRWQQAQIEALKREIKVLKDQSKSKNAPLFPIVEENSSLAAPQAPKIQNLPESQLILAENRELRIYINERNSLIQSQNNTIASLQEKLAAQNRFIRVMEAQRIREKQQLEELIRQKEEQVRKLDASLDLAMGALRVLFQKCENLRNQTWAEWICGNSPENNDVDPEALELLNAITSASEQPAAIQQPQLLEHKEN